MSTLDTGIFFDLVWGKEEGWVTLATFPRGRYEPKAPLNKDAWFAWPDQREDIVATTLINAEKDLYFCPVVFSEKNARRKDNAKSLQVVYADADECPPEKFRVPPTITVQTSPGRHHLYWLIDEEMSLEQAALLSKRIAYAHADDGCDLGGWDTTQLFRVPGTANNKTDVPYTVDASSSALLHTVEDIDLAYPASELEANRAVPNADIPDLPEHLPAYPEAWDQISDDETISQMLHVKGRAPTKTEPGNRSDLMFALLVRIAEHGCAREVALVLAWETAYCKARLKGLSKKALWAEVCNAYDYLGIPVIASDDSDTEIIEAQDHTQAATVRLLSNKERESSPVTILDRYASWARTKTDADRGYQEAAMMTVLANVFGEFGAPATKFDAGYLNTWFMVLGGTTRSRKSTVRRMMLRMLVHVSIDQYMYDLGSDATSEGLHNELLDRSRQGAVSALFQRDEVQGLLDEQNRKMYMAGLREKLTELYDGTISGKLRSAGAQQGGEIVFHLYMTGIESDVTRGFSLDDFKSGHLARFLFVRAEPPPSSRESVRIEQDEDGGYDKGIDPTYQALVEEIKRARRYWENYKKVKRGRQKKVLWDKDAWERLNEIRYNAVIWSERHRFAEVMEATVQRSLNALLKIATLLAMVEESEKVRMRHLIRATVFLERCLTDMEKVMVSVDASARDSQLNDIHAAIESCGEKGVTFKKLYSMYKGQMTSGILKALLRDLREAGYIQWDGTKAKGAGV